MQALPNSLQLSRLPLLPATTSQTADVHLWLLDVTVSHLQTMTQPAPIFFRVPRWEYVGASTVKAFEQALQQIENFYLVTNPQTVRQFVRLHPYLAELLIEAFAPLREFFGPDPQVSLSVVSDPEQEGLEELLGSILTPLPPDEALARLDAFDEYWFLDQLDRANGTLNFNLEFA